MHSKSRRIQSTSSRECHLSYHLWDGGDCGCDAFQILTALAGISCGFELAFERYGERDDAAASMRLHLSKKSQKCYGRNKSLTQAAILPSHLFFLAMKSALLMLTRYTTGLVVINGSFWLIISIWRMIFVSMQLYINMATHGNSCSYRENTKMVRSRAQVATHLRS